MGFSAFQLLEWCQGRVANPDCDPLRAQGPGSVSVERLSNLADASEGSVSFFFSREYQSDLLRAAPTVLVTADPFLEPIQKSGLPIWKSSILIACPDPYSALARVSREFALQDPVMSPMGDQPIGVHPSASVAPSAKLGAGVSIGPHSSIGEGALIGARTVIEAGAAIGAGVVIGEDSRIFPRVTLYPRTRLGARVRIHSGCVIGADGFGYAPRKDQDGKVVDHQKIWHLGGVSIGDDVEIGANTCIDRGTIGDTRIESLVKIDNLVQIGHNCIVERGAVLCGKAGLAGGAQVGQFAYIGGAAGLSNRVRVGARAEIGAFGGIGKDVPDGVQMMGVPQREPKEHFGVHAMLNRMYKERKKKS